MKASTTVDGDGDADFAAAFPGLPEIDLASDRIGRFADRGPGVGHHRRIGTDPHRFLLGNTLGDHIVILGHHLFLPFLEGLFALEGGPGANPFIGASFGIVGKNNVVLHGTLL